MTKTRFSIAVILLTGLLILSFSACSITIAPLSYTVNVTNASAVQIRLEVYPDTTTNNLISSVVVDSLNPGAIEVPPNYYLRIRNLTNDVFAQFPGPLEYWQITQAIACTVNVLGFVSF